MEVILWYHGTSKENASSILSMKKFIPGDDSDHSDYLGEGIYFFDEPSNAIFWNVRDYKIKENSIPSYQEYNKKYEIIEALIEVEKKNILNLNDASDLVKFDKIVRKFSGIFDDDESYKNAKNKNGAIINFLYKKNLIENKYVIMERIPIKVKTDEHHLANRIQRNVICVKKDSVIVDMELFETVIEEQFNDVIYLTFPVSNKDYV